jgi:glycosyltransferase involved in cell wall biosynthesis
VIYNAVDLDRFGAGVPIREALGLAPEDFVVGMVSQVAKRKGIHIFLDAAAALIPRYPNVVFVIAGAAGDDEEEYDKKVRARARQPEFQGRVRFLGARSDVPDVLASYDMFCHTARAEPLGIAVIEAMAAGLPIVAAAVGGIPEIIASPEIGSLVHQVSGETIAAAIERVIQSPKESREMGRRGAASLRGRFDPETIGASWHQLYTEMAAKRRRAMR